MAKPPDPERWRVLSPFLDRALDLAGEQRSAWLASLRVEDPELAADLERLLAEQRELEGERFLEDAPPTPPVRPSLEGTTLGSYTLRSPIGRGGMGSVWLAERSDGRFQGTAAVKLLNVELIGRDGEARFRREGEILARLRHPNIARLTDAGLSPSGQPYLVLEFVDGEPIDRYCDRRGLDVDSRIRLFLGVLGAVAHAHANLIVHRDLKPSNVLVNGEGEVKLLDFGIAKLLATEDADAGALTRAGESALTPAFAAPEQVAGGDVTTATDVYSLGVLLYLLLSGRHPAGAACRSPAELVRAIVATDAQRPSQAVSTPASGGGEEDTVQLAARRGTTPQRLRSLLRGDLDNIVAKALAKRASDRYPSVDALAADLRRYLDHQPVSARADSPAYRGAKFVRRHRAGVAAACLTLVATLAGSAGIAWQAREARRQRDAAQLQLAKATVVNDFMGFLLSVAAPGDRKLTVAELLEQAELLIDKQFADTDALRAELLVNIGQRYVASERWDRAAPVLERATDLARRSEDPGLRARALCSLAFLTAGGGNPQEAEAVIGDVLSTLPNDPLFDLPRAECLTNLSGLSYFSDRAEPMIRYATDALELLARTPAATAVRRIEAESALAYGYYLARQSRKADETYAHLLSELERVGYERALPAADIFNNWALVHDQSDLLKAEPLYRRSIELRRSVEGTGAIAPTPAFNYGGVLFRMARFEEAERYLRDAIATAGAQGEKRVQFDAMMELAGLHIETGGLARATAELAEVAAFETDRRFGDLRRAQLAYYRGRLAQAEGDPAAARPRFAEAVRIFESKSARTALSALALIGLAETEGALGEGARAAATAHRAIALAATFVEPGSPSYLVGLARTALGEIQRANGDPQAAHRSFETALEQLRQTLPPEHPAIRRASAAAAGRG